MESIKNNEITLKPLCDKNLDDFLEAIQESRNSVGVWLPWWKEDYSTTEAIEWFDLCSKEIACNHSFNLGIFQNETDKFLGGISINHIDNENKIGSIGYWVRESCQGQGIAATAVGLIIGFGFSVLNLVRLEIVILEDNVASRKVAEKCGAQLDCIAEKRLMHRGRSLPAALYSVTLP